MRGAVAGFTLVELMIVVAIIGLLAAIAIPNFTEMQYRAKRAEVGPNVQGIKVVQIGYETAYDTYLSAPAAPAAVPGKAPVMWIGNPSFEAMGWAPNGAVRGRYSVSTTSSDFVVTGESDVDGDGTQAIYTATRSIGAKATTASDVY